MQMDVLDHADTPKLGLLGEQHLGSGHTLCVCLHPSGHHSILPSQSPEDLGTFVAFPI